MMMNTFEWLCLGHLVADWLLQSDWMAIGKRKGLLSVAGFVHYSIYTSVVVLILSMMHFGSADSTSIVLIGVLVFLSHMLIDGANLVQWWMRCFGQRDQAMVRIVIDQTMHLLVLGAVATWSIEVFARAV